METSVSTFNAGLRFGFFTGLALIAFDLMLYVAGMKDPADPNPVQHLSWIMLIVGIVMGIKYYKDNNEESLSLGEAMGSGTITAVIAALVSAAYIIVFMTVIDPSMVAEMQAVAKQQAMDQNPNLTEEDYERMSGFVNMFTSPTAIAIMSVIFYAIVGAIVSLVAGLVMRNKEAA